MKAIVITSFGAPEVLKMQKRVRPVAQNQEVLIEVKAFGLNRPDIIQRKGYYPAPDGAPADIPGLEVAGIVVACGDQVTRWRPGQRVCALLAGGGYAQYAVAHEDHCLPLSEEMSYEEAAAIPETLFTVWNNVFQRGQLTENQRLLVHGGSGGIGTMAIKLARWVGATVYATAGSDERCRRCENLGATRCFNYKVSDFSEEIPSESLNVVLDSIGGDYFAKNLKLLKDDGYLVQINSTQGKRVELDLLQLMQRRFTITGSTLRARDILFKSELRHAIETHVWSAFQNREIRPEIHAIMSAAETAQAHQDLENSLVFGKIVMTWP